MASHESETMRAVGFHEHGSIEQLELLNVPIPDISATEVLLDVRAAALNHQDLFAVRELDHYITEYPFWGGGDMAGEIAAVGDDVTDWSVGDRVVVNPAISCGECQFCLAGEHSMCEEYKVFGEHRKGGFAEYAARNYGVEVVGMTISEEQVGHAREHCADLPVEIRFQDYRDVEETFDRVVSIGMFEHVGHKNHRTYMETVRRCLGAEDGLSMLHAIGNAESSSVTGS